MAGVCRRDKKRAKLQDSASQVALYRAFDGASAEGRYAIFNTNNSLGQTVLDSPTVFNFFLPAYVQPGVLAAAGLDAPEFQITTASTALSVANQVTTFTASDFSRTYNTNGDGSDHGWGSHHFLMGGAVNGGDIYGQVASLEIGGPDDTGRGRWIPRPASTNTRPRSRAGSG